MYYNLTYVENVLGIEIPKERGLHVISESLKHKIEEEQRQYETFMESLRVIIEEDSIDEGMKDFFDGAKSSVKFTKYLYNLLKQGPVKWVGFWDTYSKKIILPYKERIMAAIEKIRPISSSIASSLDKILKYLINIPNTRKIGWKAIIPAIFVAAVVRYASDIFSTLKDGLEDLPDDVKNQIKEIFEAPLSKLASVDIVREVLMKADQVKEIVTSFIGLLKTTFGPIIEQIKKGAQEIISQFIPEPTGVVAAFAALSNFAKAYAYVAETFSPFYIMPQQPQTEAKEKSLSLIKEELTKTEIKELIRDEIKKEIKKIVKDELKTVLKDRDIKNNIGDISKDILKLLYKDLSMHHGYVIDRVRI